ncbi:MAG: sulfatase-like hydrolase/transferase [Planctomycetota bacterium]|jgi:arylsulfatase A-like enzyme
MPRPNVLIFMTDHQRGDTVLSEGVGARAKMPNVDALRAEGVTFSEAFCPSPHCCPARATFMTGLYPSQHGVWHNVGVMNAITRGLADGVRTWSEDFAEAGYRMLYHGKWHVSHYESPADRGWGPGEPGADRERALPDRWPEYEKLAREPERSRGERGEGGIVTPGYPPFTLYGTSDGNQGDVRVTEKGVESLRALAAEESERPWCLFVGCTGPHDPYYVPQRFLDMYDPDEIELPPNFHDDLRDKPNFYRRTRDLFDQLTEREHREAIRHFLAYCSFEDDLFGRLARTLEETGEAANTIVMYVSDHGDYMGEHGLYAKGLPCFRGAYHVPLVVRWPEGIASPGRTVDDLVSLADIAPTFLEAAGIEKAGSSAEQELVGRSLMPFLTNEQGGRPDDWRDMLFTQSNGNELYGIQRAAFDGDWKFVYNGFDYDELYDLRADPHETRNVARDPANREVVSRMMGRIWRFAHETGDKCVNPYIMVRFAQYGPAHAFR